MQDTIDYIWFECCRVVGSILIVLGLYGVLWGKNREIVSSVYHAEEPEKAESSIDGDLESQPPEKIQSIEFTDVHVAG